MKIWILKIIEFVFSVLEKNEESNFFLTFSGFWSKVSEDRKVTGSTLRLPVLNLLRS